MSISVSHVLHDLSRQSKALNSFNQKVQKAKEEEQFIRDLYSEIVTEVNNNQSLDWRDHPNHHLLERLYELKEFEDVYPSYRFDSPSKIEPLISRIQQYHEKCQQEAQEKMQLYSDKQSKLMQLQNDSLRNISAFSNCCSSFLR